MPTRDNVFGVGVILGFGLGVIIGLLIGAAVTGPRVDEDLRNAQRQRNAWAAYMEVR